MKRNFKVDQLSRCIENEFEIKPINFEMLPGTVCGILGENGAGKTTLIRMMMKLYRSTTGEVTFGGESAFHHECAYLPEDFPYPQHMTIREIAQLEASIDKTWNTQRYKTYLELFRLTDDSKIQTLSIGEKQRLMFCLNLSRQVSCFILDEPADGIDPFERETLVNILREYIYQHEASVIVSTHNVKGIESMLDYVLYLEQGSCVLFSDIEQFSEAALKVLTTRQLDSRAFEANPTVANFVSIMQGGS